MNLRLRCLAAIVSVGAISLAVPAITVAAPTDATDHGITSVTLAPSFLSALESLGVKPGAVAPGRVVHRRDNSVAAFPITAGAIDLGAVKGEIDHAGGLSLSDATNQVELTGFAIELYPDSAPVLTGLVTVDGSFVGRLPLFDLSLANAALSKHEERLAIRNVAISLDPAAAAALSNVFQTSVPAGLPIGTATVRASLDDGDEG
jgi:hypothetical protein